MCHTPYQNQRHLGPIMTSPRQMRLTRIILVDLIAPNNPKRVVGFNYPPRQVNLGRIISVMSATIHDRIKLPKSRPRSSKRG
eukprot:scaffold2572_cov75-Skeletonema_marinoi.AAC.33